MCWSHSAAVLMLFLMTKTLTNLHFCKKNPKRRAILPIHEGILACRDGLHGVTCLSAFRRMGASPWGLDAAGKKGGKWTYPSAEEWSHRRVESRIPFHREEHFLMHYCAHCHLFCLLISLKSTCFQKRGADYISEFLFTFCFYQSLCSFTILIHSLFICSLRTYSAPAYMLGLGQ